MGFYLADAVLPMNPFGRIRTGEEAEFERTHAGLYWPPEARVQRGKPLRRVPIPYAWRVLVEAGDRTVRWNVGRGVSFPLPRILANHLAGLVADGTLGQGLSQQSDTPKELRGTQLVVTIADNLDEFGQEALLRELGRKGLKEIMLIWRPVAAALSWLDKVEGDFPSHMGENDHIHVVYLGADAFEFTTFRLRVKDHNNRLYVLPLRDRPKDLPRLSGIDWAGRLIEKSFEGIDHGAFWQAFTNFPEIWEAIAGRAWNQEELPRAWSLGQDWGLWNPSSDLYNLKYNVQAEPCNTLRDIFRYSCQLDPHEKASLGPMGKALRMEVRRLAELFPGGKLRGMVVCGPLLHSGIPPWLAAELETLSARGLGTEGELTEPESGRLWLCADCDDPVAEGAAIYGRRTLGGVPSYLDTMPQISILAQGQGQYAWVPLLNAQEVLGGTEFKDTIEGRFQLDRGRRKLHVFLCKGSSEDVSIEPDDPFDAQAISHEGLTPCQARIVREEVRKLGSLAAVRGRGFYKGTNNSARYGLSFAEALFKEEGDENDELQEPSSVEIGRTPLRRAVFDFPSTPSQDVALNVGVRMRPASGLAKVELIPRDTSFLQGKRVRLNYSTMRKTTRLPKRQRGWPRIQELIADPYDGILREGRHFVELFENISPKASNYIEVIDDIRDKVLKRTAPEKFASLELWVRAIDQNGQACTSEGNDIIERIASKFENDFNRVDVARMVALKDKMFSRATWLYTSTPHNVTAYVNDVLAGNFKLAKWNHATEAASRTFVTLGDFSTFFKAIADRARKTIDGVQPFPIQAARSICRVLMFRKDGHKGLDSKMAKLLARRASDRLYKEQKRGNYKNLYFQLILLLLYLLRYRKTDPSSFDPNSPQTIEVFEEAIGSMSVAKKFFYKTHDFRKAKRVQNIIDGFEKYLHYEGTEDILTVLGDLAGDMA